jgi:hypothetical protein
MEYRKTRPYALQFSTRLGHHVFATDTKDELEMWIDKINTAIEDDRKRQRKKTKSKIAQEAGSLSAEASTDRSSESINPTALMGAYQAKVVDNEFSAKIKAHGEISVQITPRGIKLMTPTNDANIAAWQYKYIKSYSKSANQTISLEIGNNAKTGAGKFVFSSSSTREMFSMINRNIKILKDKLIEAQNAKSQEEAEEIRRKKRSSTGSMLRPHSMSYEVQQADDPNDKRTSYPTYTHRPSIPEDDLLQLGEFAEHDEVDGFEDTFTSGSSGYPPLDNEITNDLYETIDSLPRPNLQPNVTDPFSLAGVDPFNTSAQGSFYNSHEDIFDNFSANTSQQQRTSTPSGYAGNNPFASGPLVNPVNTSTNPFASPSGIDKQMENVQLVGDHIYSVPRKQDKKMSREEFDQVWKDITSDIVLP